MHQAWSSGTPVAIQPVGGHLEFVKARLGTSAGMYGVEDPLPNTSITEYCRNICKFTGILSFCSCFMFVMFWRMLMILINALDFYSNRSHHQAPVPKIHTHNIYLYYVHTYIYIYMHIYMHMYIYIYMIMCILVYVYVLYMCVYVYICIYVYVICICIILCTYIYIYRFSTANV